MRTIIFDEFNRAELRLMDKMFDIMCGRTRWYHNLAYRLRWWWRDLRA